MSLDENIIYETQLVKARTMPDMIGPWPIKAVMFALLPIILSVLTRGSWLPLLLLPVTVPVAAWVSRDDVYIVDVLLAATSLKSSRTKAIWGMTRYVPR